MIQVQKQSGVEATMMGGIQRGMPVYDIEDVMLGVVGQIHHGRDTDEFVPEEFDLWTGVPDIPMALMTRMWHQGYLEIDTGLLFGNYLVLSHQIADVTDDGVFLLCFRDDLIQL